MVADCGFVKFNKPGKWLGITWFPARPARRQSAEGAIFKSAQCALLNCSPTCARGGEIEPVTEKRAEGHIENLLHKEEPVPNPTPAPEGGRDPEVFCSRYDACLDRAITGAWPGFSCRECSGFEQLGFDAGEWLHDAHACAALVVAVLRPGSCKRLSRRKLFRGGSMSPYDPEE